MDCGHSGSECEHEIMPAAETLFGRGGIARGGATRHRQRSDGATHLISPREKHNAHKVMSTIFFVW